MEGEDALVIGDGNSALQTVENLHTVAPKIYLISNSELSGDAVGWRGWLAFPNLQTYIGYKVVEFKGNGNLTGVTIRRIASDETLDLPVKGAFIAVGLKPNSALVAHLVKVNHREEIMIHADCSTSCPGI